MCSGMPLSCDKLSCKKDGVYEIVKANFNTWTFLSILMLNHEKVSKMLFGKFAKDLINILQDSKKINILSAHDNSLAYVLAGLLTKVIERPPLASAIFFRSVEVS